MPAAAALPKPKSTTGRIVIGIASIDCLPTTTNFCEQLAVRNWGVTESLFFWHRREDGTINYMEPQLAESWDLSPDLKTLTVTIRKGVKFHKGWGELTADDVAMSYDHSNVAVTPQSIVSSAAYLASFLGKNPVEVVDKYTVRFHISKFDVRWGSFMLNSQGWVGTLVTSKRVLEEKGEEWMTQNLIGTGPFQVEEWVEQDHVTMTRFPDHWRYKPEVEQITLRAIPEESVRIAGLKAGDLDAAFIGMQNVPGLVKQGFKTSTTGSSLHQTIWFTGNLWDDVNRQTGEPLKPHPKDSGVYARPVPWVGNPWNDQWGNPPPGMTSLERARLVRWALAIAIDRDAINQALLGGLGYPVYIGSYDPRSQYWDDKWKYPYDPAKAEELLDQAGYPRGSDGVRFAMPLFVPNPNDTPIALEIADAIGGYWEKIGVKTQVLKYAYSVYRPGLVERGTTVPYLTWWDDGNGIYPWDWPRGLAQSSLTRGSFSNGFETPYIAENYLKTAAEPDPQKRIQLQNELADYLQHWALQPGVVAIPVLILYNPRSIAEWEQEPSPFQIHGLWKIVPAKR